MTVVEVSNIRAILIFTTYLTINTSLFLVISSSIRDASRRLVASRRPRGEVALFSMLEAASLAITWYYMLSFFSLSYESWAFDHGVRLPARPSIWSLDEIREALAAIRLGAWLKDVKLFRDAWETVVETPARTCWSMPIFFITTVWSMFIAKEASRKNIRYAWAYMLLGQLVAISFATNLFYLAVILHTPQIGPRRSENGKIVQLTRSPKAVSEASTADSTTSLWTPPDWVYWTLLSLTFTSIAMATTSAGDKNFMLYLALPHVLLLLPPVLNSVLPRRFGIQHADELSYNNFYTNKIILTLLLGAAFEIAALFFALNTPSTRTGHSHRHSNVHTYPWRADLIDGTETSLQSLWRSLRDHPAVSSVGWDSILCTASFVAWRMTGSVT